MKNFKCTASIRGVKKSKKAAKNQVVFESRSFKFAAKNFEQAVVIAEKIAKKIMVFESLKISEV